MVETKQHGSVLIPDLIENGGARMIIGCAQQACVPRGTFFHILNGDNGPYLFHRVPADQGSYVTTCQR
jgi:hypothetical protein